MSANGNGREKTWNGRLARKHAKKKKKMVNKEQEEKNNCAEKIEINLGAKMVMGSS